METFSLIINTVFQLGLGLGVGASTIALSTYVVALADGTIDASERRILHLVYAILRIAMVLIGAALIVSLVFGTMQIDLQYAVQWAFFGALVVNALLMTYRKISMQFGPALQGATWYALYFATLLPVQRLPYIVITVLYVLWVFVVYLIVRTALARVTKP